MLKVTRFMKWESAPEIHGYAAAIAGPSGDVLAEAAVTVCEDGTAGYDVFGLDGITAVATGHAASTAEALAAAEYAMRRSVTRLVAA